MEGDRERNRKSTAPAKKVKRDAAAAAAPPAAPVSTAVTGTAPHGSLSRRLAARSNRGERNGARLADTVNYS
jgi:hypothetical protein